MPPNSTLIKKCKSGTSHSFLKASLKVVVRGLKSAGHKMTFTFVSNLDSYSLSTKIQTHTSFKSNKDKILTKKLSFIYGFISFYIYLPTLLPKNIRNLKGGLTSSLFEFSDWKLSFFIKASIYESASLNLYTFEILSLGLLNGTCFNFLSETQIIFIRLLQNLYFLCEPWRASNNYN